MESAGDPASEYLHGPLGSLQNAVHSHVGLALTVEQLSAGRSVLAGMISADTEIVAAPRLGAFMPDVPIDGWLVCLYSIGEEDSGPLVQQSTSDASSQGLIDLISSMRMLS
ncbi:hypothetical protein CFP75_00690 [Amycolatopsis alba DSM 44262]|uniref:Uncharacterized protein n=1 Tax=Amycolatopsis alba DSM 44262 TaxID=1125972 RepID=A0A229S9Q2_AMYAL|nr:hypothetical protein CFP75_00690 [Amycolatopsis alba DSM 44262]